MIRAELTSHPLTPAQSVRSIIATVQRKAQSVEIVFLVHGEIAKIALPARQAASRADELWQHTCFELFARPQRGPYTEFNFAPSLQWAAYTFCGYREGMTPRELHRSPTMQIIASDEVLQFDVHLDSRDLPMPTAQLALTAVIEEVSGLKSYWAVNHRKDKPDFHYEHGFVLMLN